MASQAEPGAGDVPITLDGEQLVLRPSLEACLAISRLAGNSLDVAMQRVFPRLDFEFICEIIALGIGATSPTLKREVQAKVFREGTINVAADAQLFIRVIMNGGRIPTDEEVDEQSDRPLETASPSETTISG